MGEQDRYALSYPLVEALVTKLDECIESYHFIWAGDHLQSACLADLGADFTPEKGFHQMDLRGDLSGLLSSHPTAPLLSLHHFEVVKPLFPGMDRPGSVLHIMKAGNVDQSRILQQSICHVRARNWTFSVSWGYSAHIYEKIFPRSHLMRPIETFRPWRRTALTCLTRDRCLEIHVKLLTGSSLIQLNKRMKKLLLLTQGSFLET